MSSALVIVDVQYDFLPALPEHSEKGSLAVENSDEILPHIRRLLDKRYKWAAVAVSQDYHPEGHISFASTHGLPTFSKITIPNSYTFDRRGEPRPETIQQVLWPDHCIMGTTGSEIEQSVRSALSEWSNDGEVITIRKGSDKGFEAYSAFLSDPRKPPKESDLALRLRERGVASLFVVGIATDFCVRATALDAERAGFKVFVISEAVRAVGGIEATEKTRKEWEERGIQFISIDGTRLQGVLSESSTDVI